jgi:hypothetical protein
VGPSGQRRTAARLGAHLSTGGSGVARLELMLDTRRRTGYRRATQGDLSGRLWETRLGKCWGEINFKQHGIRSEVISS